MTVFSGKVWISLFNRVGRRGSRRERGGGKNAEYNLGEEFLPRTDTNQHENSEEKVLEEPHAEARGRRERGVFKGKFKFSVFYTLPVVVLDDI